jgi:hypothetical protein
MTDMQNLLRQLRKVNLELFLPLPECRPCLNDPRMFHGVDCKIGCLPSFGQIEPAFRENSFAKRLLRNAGSRNATHWLDSLSKNSFLVMTQDKQRPSRWQFRGAQEEGV